MRKLIISLTILSILTLLLVSGCDKNEQESSIETAQPQSPEAESTGAVKMDEGVVSQGDEVVDPLLANQEIDYRDLEVTYSGEPKCFLSPCDCNCYVIPNVPASKRKFTCATDCQDVYGINGCQFTNFQCATI